MMKKILLLILFAISNVLSAYIVIHLKEMSETSLIFQRNLKESEDLHLIIDTLIANIRCDPTATVSKLVVLRNNIPISYEGVNVKIELINCGLLDSKISQQSLNP